MSAVTPATPDSGRVALLAPAMSLAAQPAIRRALPALGSLTAILLAGAAWYSLQTPSQRAMFNGLADADKSAIADALQTAGVAHAIDRDTGDITVADSDYHRARILLAAQGLPKAAPSGDALRANLPMGASRAVEGETLRGAREADLARTIEAIDSVKTARIHIATSEPSPFLRDDHPAAASVMLTLQQGRSMTESQVRAIAHLVASAVPGMPAEQVSIVDQTGRLLSQNMSGDDKAFDLQTQIENRARRSMNALLGPILGNENYTAEIHADLDVSESQSTRETFPKDDRALLREEGNRTSGGAAGPGAAAIGIPGVFSNSPPAAPTVTTTPPAKLASTTSSASSVPGQSASDATQGDEQYSRSFGVGREISVTHQPVGRLRRLTVAVAVRDLQGAKPRPAAEIAALESLVKGAIGFDASRGDIVAVAARPFIETKPEPVAFYDKPWFMTLIRQLGAIVGAILAFVLVGRPLRRALKARSETAAQNRQIGGELLAMTGNARAPVTLDMIEAAPSYQARANLVRDFVKQDSAKAATVVRQLMAERRDG